MSLVGAEADIYEAVATLEFPGRPVTAADVASAARMDADAVQRALGSLAERGIITGRPGTA